MKNFIGSNIKAIRVDKGLSQSQIAKLAGVQQAAVSSWELGNATPRRSAVVRLASALGLSEDDIMSDEMGYANKPLYREDDLPALPVVRGPEEIGRPSTKCRDRFVAPPEEYSAHPDAVYVEVPDDRVNRKIPRGYIAMVDTSDTNLREDGMYCVCVDGRIVFGYVSMLTNGFELVPRSYDPTATPVVVGRDDDADIIGAVVRATMPPDYEI